MRRLFFKGRQSEELFQIKGNKETYNEMQYMILDWIQDQIHFKEHHWINQQSWNMDVTLKCFINVKFLKWEMVV